MHVDIECSRLHATHRDLWEMVLDKVPSKPALQLVVSTAKLVLQ